MSERKSIEVFADWTELGGPILMGWLSVSPSRGKEIFSFEYEPSWLSSRHHSQLDPALGLYAGAQYPTAGQPSFGVFLDSAPDRWGRVLMRRREAHLARVEGRRPRRLAESDYLLGVFDGHRPGALRFSMGGPFLDDDEDLATPPWTSLRDLEHASWQLEREDADSNPDLGKWLAMLVVPGSSLGGARPKASVIDEQQRLWIAKFPSRHDTHDVGAWEGVVHTLARRAGVSVPEARTRRFGARLHTFLSRRFDRTEGGRRLHMASAMTLLERRDGDDADEGVSYLELADLLTRLGGSTAADLEQLWRRIVFFVCVSNTDDHLRNHSFMLTPRGWVLSPAYDMNPDPLGGGLKLNISETDNAQDLDLALEVAPHFRLGRSAATEILDEVRQAVRSWPQAAEVHGLGRPERDRMRWAFRLADTGG